MESAAAWSQAGSPLAGSPQEGVCGVGAGPSWPADSEPGWAWGTPHAGVPPRGTPHAGVPARGSPHAGAPAAGSPQEGISSASPPQESDWPWSSFHPCRPPSADPLQGSGWGASACRPCHWGASASAAAASAACPGLIDSAGAACSTAACAGEGCTGAVGPSAPGAGEGEGCMGAGCAGESGDWAGAGEDWAGAGSSLSTGAPTSVASEAVSPPRLSPSPSALRWMVTMMSSKATSSGAWGLWTQTSTSWTRP